MENDRAWLGSLLDHVPELVKGVTEAYEGITVEAFEQPEKALAEADKRDWTVVSMKDNFTTVFEAADRGDTRATAHR